MTEPSTFTVGGVFSITGRGTVLTGERVGPLRTGQYLYGPRFGFQIRGIEMHTTLGRSELERDKVGVLARPPAEFFQTGETFTTEPPREG